MIDAMGHTDFINRSKDGTCRIALKDLSGECTDMGCVFAETEWPNGTEKPGVST
jgi:hypothetical protein